MWRWINMKINLPAKPEPIKLDINRTALIVVDMQNTFCKKGGIFDYMGKLDEAKVKRVINNDKKVIEACRNKGIKIVYLQMGYRKDLSNAGGRESPNYYKELAVALMRNHPELKGRFLTIGTWDWEIVDELKPHPEDIVVDKHFLFLSFFQALLCYLNLLWMYRMMPCLRSHITFNERYGYFHLITPAN